MSFTTANGMGVLNTSNSHNVDLFFAIGSARGVKKEKIIAKFEAAFAEDEVLALKSLFHARNVRGGSGERQVFRDIIKTLEHTNTNKLIRLLPLFSHFGRWDDLLIFENPMVKNAAYDLIWQAIKNKNGLCAKWMPRNGHLAKEMRDYFKVSPKFWRKTLVGLTDVVEQDMCAKKWDSIELSKLPSLAMARYQNSFIKHCPENVNKYKEDLKNGKTKINVNALYPYDVIKSLKNGDEELSSLQWANLPNFLGDDKILPIVDVSGSMMQSVAKNKNLMCLDVAIALGLYIADKQEGEFKDIIVTFSERPNFVHLNGGLLDKYNQLVAADWGASTNLEATFDMLLKMATTNHVPPENMPKTILLMSDMQFNKASKNITSFEMIKEKYQNEGYHMPTLVFWQMNAEGMENSIPVSFNQEGVMMISGFSVAILESVLKAENPSPETIMLDTLNDKQYDVVEKAWCEPTIESLLKM